VWQYDLIRDEMEAVFEAWDDAMEEGANKIASAGPSTAAAGPSTAPSGQKAAAEPSAAPPPTTTDDEDDVVMYAPYRYQSD